MYFGSEYLYFFCGRNKNYISEKKEEEESWEDGSVIDCYQLIPRTLMVEGEN